MTIFKTDWGKSSGPSRAVPIEEGLDVDDAELV